MDTKTPGNTQELYTFANACRASMNAHTQTHTHKKHYIHINATAEARPEVNI